MCNRVRVIRISYKGLSIIKSQALADLIVELYDVSIIGEESEQRT